MRQTQSFSGYVYIHLHTLHATFIHVGRGNDMSTLSWLCVCVLIRPLKNLSIHIFQEEFGHAMLYVPYVHRNFDDRSFGSFKQLI